jgi:hypothetical protein
MQDDDSDDETNLKVTIGVLAMAKKSQSKPMKEILMRLVVRKIAYCIFFLLSILFTYNIIMYLFSLAFLFSLIRVCVWLFLGI